MSKSEPGRPRPGVFGPGALKHARLAAWCVALACVYAKVVVSFDPFPYWGSDPTRVVLPVTGLTPGPSMLLDCIILIACGAALLFESLLGAPLKRALIT